MQHPHGSRIVSWLSDQEAVVQSEHRIRARPQTQRLDTGRERRHLKAEARESGYSTSNMIQKLRAVSYILNGVLYRILDPCFRRRAGMTAVIDISVERLRFPTRA